MKLDGKSFGCGLLAGVLLSLGLVAGAGVIGFLAYRSIEASTADVKPPPPLESIPAAGDPIVTDALKPILIEHNVPALAAALLTSEGIQFMGGVGFRKRGSDVPVQLGDHWHLGSDGKAMTATLIARLVERGDLRWDARMDEVFPDLADVFHADMKAVTLELLLTHRAGLPPNLSLLRYQGQDVRKLRRRAVKEYLGDAPSHPPGSEKVYSNLGYIIAGAAVEATLDKTWEEAMREDVFGPLKMDTAGFGGTGTEGEIDQPWPHGDNGAPKPSNGPEMDNPPVMGPAGRIHCSMADWAKFVQDQLRGARGEPGTLLKPETYARLHTPPADGDYAFGWGVTERDWGGGRVLQHGGDNTMNHANVWIAPHRNFAVIACVNQGGDTAFEATDAAVSALIRLWESREAEAAAP